MQIAFFLAILGLLVFDTGAMASLKRYTEDNKYAWIALAVVLEAVAWIFLIWGVKKKGLVITNTVWDVTSAIMIALVGLFIFKEKLTTRQFIGLVAGLAAVALLTI